MNLKNFEEKYLDKIKLIEKEQNLKLEDKSLINYIYAKYEKKKSINNFFIHLFNNRPRFLNFVQAQKPFVHHLGLFHAKHLFPS